MKELEKKIKEVQACVDMWFTPNAKIKKEIQKLEKERNTLLRKRTERIYDNYEIDRIIQIINIKIDTLKEILGGK